MLERIILAIGVLLLGDTYMRGFVFKGTYATTPCELVAIAPAQDVLAVKAAAELPGRCSMRTFCDANRSILAPEEIARFKSEIAKRKGGLVCCRMSTMEVAEIGAKAMAADGFRLIKEQLDV